MFDPEINHQVQSTNKALHMSHMQAHIHIQTHELVHLHSQSSGNDIIC